ncbi:MAG: O-antigen ligase family protein [Candidatus Moranbacteria bacterium]|nr:O-antigen ligase family protein [Candidatus Moranbacteria bacterium]
MKKIVNLENLIYLTIFALPVYLWRISFINALDILIIACVIGWLIFYQEGVDYRALFKKHKPFIFSTGIILLGLIVSVLVNKNYATGLGIIKSWFLLPMALAFVVSQVIEEKKLKNVFLSYYASAFFVALVSLGYYFYGNVTFDLRLQGFFNSPNYLAMYLAPAIFIGYALFFETKTGKKGLVFSSLAVILAALCLTYSYASWISVALVFGFVFRLGKKINWKKYLLGLFLLVILFFSQLEKNKLQSLVSFDSRSSLASRMMIWQSAEKMLENNALFGIGAGNFQEKYLAYQKYFPPYLEWAVPHPHSLYLAFWLYGGVFSLAGFLALVYFWFAHIFRSQKNPQLKFIGLGIMGYILLHGIVDTTYFKNDLTVVFWLLFVLL